MRCCGFGFAGWHADASRETRAPWRESPPSGSAAFDEYRAETLRRLAEEQRAFGEFLAQLRMAKDMAEFDQFMAARRRAPQPAPSPGSAPGV
ncbi:MAG TPA: DUF2852 domain-containing protein [Xanthobacteraceae bacterium]|nr:DUF2852 domain-containing protein [Xanthobacteraceae bacterium]